MFDMKLNYSLVFIVFFSATVFAQEGSYKPTTAFPRIENKFDIKSKPVPASNEAKYSIAKPFEPTKFKTAPKVYDAPSLEKPNKFNNIVSDLDPGLEFEKKLNKKLSPNTGIDNSKPFRGNQFLGEFKTGSDAVGIIYRDHGEVDGDLIRVLVNDKIAIYEIYLSGSFQELNLQLKKGFNKVEFEALNQGTSGPNTAEVQVWDDKGKLITSNQWNLATGFKASIIVFKE
jgi:hypothetical protein